MYDKEKIVSLGKQAFVKRPTFLKRAFSYTNFLIATILGFAVLTFFVRQYDYFNFDLTITIFIQKYSQNWFDLLMRLITLMGNGPAVGIIVIALSLYGYLIGKRHSPLLLVISTFGGIIISKLLKILVAGPRPDPSLINQISHFLGSDSFPSGHVLTAISLYGFILYIAYTQLKKSLVRKFIIGFCLSIILLMGVSRIYLGAHWFSDVLGAYLIGFVWLSVIIFVYHKFKKV